MTQSKAQKAAAAKTAAPAKKAAAAPPADSGGDSGANPPRSQNDEQSKEPTKADVKRAQGPGGQPGATLPRPDRVEGLSSAMAGPMQGAGGDPSAFRENIEKAQAEGAGESGPNHDLADPTPENTARMPSALVGSGAGPDSGPLEPPTDTVYQRFPEAGYDLSSSDHTYASVGGRTVAGESHLGLVDEDGKPVKASSLFEDEDGKTFVTVKARVFEQFRYPNTVEVAKRLLYTPGQRVNRAEAERIKATL